MPGTNRTAVIPSSWAKMDLWQSPKSRPHILRFLSAPPVAISAESEETSMAVTGSLWPYNERKNLRVSAKNTLNWNEVR